MNKTLALLAAAGFAFSTAAIAAEEKAVVKSETKIEKHADGSSKKETKTHQEHKDASGKTSADVKTSVKTDAKGETKKVVETEKVNDPKGMLNKEKTATKETIKTDAAGNVTEHSKKVDGKDAAVEAAPAAGAEVEKH